MLSGDIMSLNNIVYDINVKVRFIYRLAVRIGYACHNGFTVSRA